MTYIIVSQRHPCRAHTKRFKRILTQRGLPVRSFRSLLPLLQTILLKPFKRRIVIPMLAPSRKLSKLNFSLFLLSNSPQYFVKFFYSFLFVGFFERNNHYRSLHVFSFNGDTCYIGIVYTGITQNSMPMTCLYNFK